MAYATYKSIHINSSVSEEGKVLGFTLDGLDTVFESPAEAMRYIDGLEAFSALNGAIVSFKE